MLELLQQLSFPALILLCSSLFLVLLFEFINGFHDTANAVATVIYTQAMRPWHAVILSGFFNFVGVLAGGLAVAYSIVNLLPVDLLTSGDSRHLTAMIFAILLGAIIWNLGTWYLGLPASSSHTLIGSIIGVGITHTLVSHVSWTTSINWDKAIDVGLSLLLSPLLGFTIAGLMLFSLKKWLPDANIHQTPYLRNDLRGKKHPPFWTRFLLILSSAGVSFAHGSNDGQKGVGLMMLALLCIIPSHFLINTSTERYQVERAFFASQQLSSFVIENKNWISSYLPKQKENQQNHHCQLGDVDTHSQGLQELLASNVNINKLNNEQRWQLRRNLLCLSATAKKLSESSYTNKNQQEYLNKLRKDFTSPVEYAPLWVVVIIALALAIGTTVGWKRVVHTIGSGIGRSHMTYAQGVCAQLTTALSIAMANVFGLPVSTTQILSSSVAGTAVANKSGLQKNNIINILMTWVLTLPAAVLISGILYFIIILFL